MAKAISLKQPFAWGAVHGWKDCENRSWYTDYRGPVWIHASKSPDNILGTEPADWAKEGRKVFPGASPGMNSALAPLLGWWTWWIASPSRLPKVGKNRSISTGIGACCWRMPGF